MLSKSKHNGYSPLLMASYYGHVEVVRYLLQFGADLNKTDHVILFIIAYY